MDEKLLIERLKDYAALDVLPMHMPGHKRNMERYPWLKELGGSCDITEIDGFDDLVETDYLPGVRSFLSVNGSTGGILAAVRTAVRPGKLLLMGRNCHKAVYHAAEICGARVRYLLPDWDAEWGIFSRVQPETVEAALKEAEEQERTMPAAVVITSPTYEGDVSDVKAMAELCHARGVSLIVDEAHGAHFGLPGFPQSAVACGADIVIQSLHKTLPSPTQTSVIHCRSKLLSAEELKRQLLMFQTSSPSFLLMGAAEKAVAYVKEHGAREAMEWLRRNHKLKLVLEELPGLKLRKADDPSKLLIASGLPGAQWMDRLRKTYRIEAEMAENRAVLFMTAMGDTKEGMERLADALRTEAGLQKEGLLPIYEPGCYPVPDLPQKEMEACEAVRLPKVLCPLSEAEGRVSADYQWKYPPGIPFLVPGERIGAAAVEKAAALGRKALLTLP